MLTAGPTPDVSVDEWSLRIDGVVAEERGWSWEEFHRLAFEDVPCDIHCVTKWSKLGTSFRGVSMDTLLDEVEPLGAYAMVYSYGGYTTNLAIEDLTDGKACGRPSTRANRCRASTVGRRGCWCRTCTSGRAPSGSPGCG